jgi:hypothetical protein
MLSLQIHIILLALLNMHSIQNFITAGRFACSDDVTIIAKYSNTLLVMNINKFNVEYCDT